MFELFWRLYILGHTGMLNNVTCTGTQSKDKIWVGGTSGLFFTDWRAHVKTKQTNSLRNVNCIINELWMCCEGGRIPLWYFWVWNVNFLGLLLLNMKLYMFVKFSCILVIGETLSDFSQDWSLLYKLDSIRMLCLLKPNPRNMCILLVWPCVF